MAKKSLINEINKVIEQMFYTWDGSEIATIQNVIAEEAAEDVIETSDYPNHNDSDIRIAIKRVLLNKITND